MHRLRVQSSIGRSLARPSECPHAARCFSTTSSSQADERPAPTRSAKAFDMISKLPASGSSSRGGARPAGSSGAPKELVRRVVPPGSENRSSTNSRPPYTPRPNYNQDRAPTSRFNNNPNTFRSGGPPGARGRNGEPSNSRSPRKSNTNNRRSTFNPNAEEEDDTSPAEDSNAADRSTYAKLTDDSLIDRFTSLAEARAYAQLQDFVEDYIERAETLDEMESEASSAKKLDPQYAKALEGVRKEMDGQIREALEFANRADETALPRHEPQEVPLEGNKGEVGGATIGMTGMAGAVEEGLRYIGKRQGIFGSQYLDTKTLAQRLVDGEFVKFRHAWEKREVLTRAETLGVKKDTEKGSKHVGFEELPEEARRVLVSKLVQGQYRDPQDLGLSSGVLRNVARIAGGNASVTGESKAKMLKAIGELLPAERPVGQRGAQRKRA